MTVAGANIYPSPAGLGKDTIRTQKSDYKLLRMFWWESAGMRSALNETEG